MKIRIKGNSIRYRLTKTEVKTFCETGYVEEKTDFGDATFTYALKALDGINGIGAKFQSNTITLFLEKYDSRQWYESNQISFHHNIEYTDGTVLHLLIEKDFVCMDEREEDQSDNYPNPKMK